VALYSNSCGYEIYMTSRWEKYNVAAIDPPWVNPGSGAYFDNAFDVTNQSCLISRFSKLPSSTSQNFSICSNDSVTLPGGTVVTVGGTYYDTLSNISGCDSIIATIVTIKPSSSDTLNPNICSGGSYTLPGGNSVSTSGTFKDTLTNSVGCDSIITIILTVSPVINITISPSICYGATYTLPNGNVVSTAGTYSDTLSAIGGCDSVITTNLTINPIITFSQNISICMGTSYTLPGGGIVSSAGTYIDTITTSTGCDSSITTNLTVNPIISFSQNVSICFGTSYTLPGGGIVSSAGTYIDTITTSAGCDSSITTNLTVNPVLSASQNISICTGTSYTLPGGNSVSTAGTYYDTLTTTKGCDSIITTQLTVNPLPQITSTTTTLTCINLSDTIFANTNVSNASYSWTGSGIVSGNNSSSPIINTPGSYTVTITDPATGCSKTSTVTVTQNISTPNLSTGSSLTLTCTTTNGTINANSTTPGATYSWAGPGIVSGGATSTATVNSTGTYTVIITNPQNGCTTTGTVIVNNNLTPPTITQGSNLMLHCNLNSGNISVTTGTSGATYSWTGPGIVSGATTSSPTVNSAGTYTVIVTDPNNGCTSSSTITVTTAPPPVATATGSTTISLGSSTQLIATGGPSYNWTPSSGLSCTTCANPSASPTDTTTYCVVITDQYGCKDSACVTVNVFDECPPLNKEASIPNVFTPNEDGMNDYFYIGEWNNECTTNFFMEIYDRWGIKMFETKSSNVFWDGKTTAGVNVVEGVYYYIIKVKRVRGEEKMYQGTISVIK